MNKNTKIQSITKKKETLETLNSKRKNTILTLGIAASVYMLVMLLMKFGLLSRQMTSLIIPICTNVMLAVSLCLIVGFLGELSLGHAGFMSIGAYAGAIFSTNVSLPPVFQLFFALIIGGTVAALLGLIVGVPVLRLRGDYLAIVTLGFGEIIKSIFNTLSITNGAKGLSGIPIIANYKYFTFVYLIMLFVILCVTNLVHSRHGRMIAAVRDNYIAAQSTGIAVSRCKIMAFIISAFFAGMAGVIYAHNIGFLKPVNFNYNRSIEILVMVVLGGMGNIKGSIVAAFILTILPEVLRGADEFRMLLYAIALIALMLFNHSKWKQNLMEKRAQKKAERR